MQRTHKAREAVKRKTREAVKRKTREAVKGQLKKQARQSSAPPYSYTVVVHLPFSEESDHSDTFDSLRKVVARLKALKASFVGAASKDQIIPVIEVSRT